ncbi:MAG: hypothetical protein SVS85_04565, partial [Candidatus Nanohaloarchaea archaeon]|nr:hypothetical protein [Candidatus Nanohaloarchaea archaeon]
MDVELEGDIETDIEQIMAAVEAEEDWIYAQYPSDVDRDYEQEMRERIEKKIAGEPYVWEFEARTTRRTHLFVDCRVGMLAGEPGQGEPG